MQPQPCQELCLAPTPWVGRQRLTGIPRLRAKKVGREEGLGRIGVGRMDGRPNIHSPPRPGEFGAPDPPQRSPCICHPWKCADPLGNASSNGGSRVGTRLTVGVGPLAPPAALQGVGQHQLGVSGPPPRQEGVNQPLHSSPTPPWNWDALPNGSDGETEAVQGQEGPPSLIPLGHWEGWLPPANEGLRAGLQDPHGMGGTTLGSTPPGTAASLPPIPSFPSQGGKSHTGREGRQHRPHCPVPPEHPLLP